MTSELQPESLTTREACNVVNKWSSAAWRQPIQVLAKGTAVWVRHMAKPHLGKGEHIVRYDFQASPVHFSGALHIFCLQFLEDGVLDPQEDVALPVPLLIGGRKIAHCTLIDVPHLQHQLNYMPGFLNWHSPAADNHKPLRKQRAIPQCCDALKVLCTES